MARGSGSALGVAPAGSHASTLAHRSYFWMVLSSTPPVRYRIWPPMVDFPASTCPMNTTFRWSLHNAHDPLEPDGCDRVVPKMLLDGHRLSMGTVGAAFRLLPAHGSEN